MNYCDDCGRPRSLVRHGAWLLCKPCRTL